MRGQWLTICELCTTKLASSVPAACTTSPPPLQRPCITMPIFANPHTIGAIDNDDDREEEEDYEDDNNGDEDNKFEFKEDLLLLINLHCQCS